MKNLFFWILKFRVEVRFLEVESALLKALRLHALQLFHFDRYLLLLQQFLYLHAERLDSSKMIVCRVLVHLQVPLHLQIHVPLNLGIGFLEGEALLLQDLVFPGLQVDFLLFLRLRGLKELRDELFAALESLNETHREILLLRELEGLSYGEISEMLDIPIGTVMSRIHHARKKVQQQMKPYLEPETSGARYGKK